MKRRVHKMASSLGGKVWSSIGPHRGPEGQVYSYSGHVSTPEGLVLVDIGAGRHERDVYTMYRTILDGCQHWMTEYGINRSATGAARVAHRWIKELVSEGRA